MKNKICLSICLSICLLFVFAVPSFAISTGSDLLGSSSNVSNLTSLIPDRAVGKYDYIVFSDSDYSYYCYYGNNFTINNNVVIANDCNYIRYYRTGSLGSTSYTYSFGRNDLNLTVNHLVGTNLNLQKGSNNFNFDNYQNNNIVYISAIVVAVFIVFNTLRGWIGGRVY